VGLNFGGEPAELLGDVLLRRHLTQDDLTGPGDLFWTKTGNGHCCLTFRVLCATPVPRDTGG
jgi:hypothetical protein